MSYLEIKPDGGAEDLPGLQECRNDVEAALMRLMKITHPEIDDVDWMPASWTAHVEAIGYNREGRKFRGFEILYPAGQSTSATLGVTNVTQDGYLAALAEATELPDED